jgi:hypothetical protein
MSRCHVHRLAPASRNVGWWALRIMETLHGLASERAAGAGRPPNGGRATMFEIAPRAPCARETLQHPFDPSLAGLSLGHARREALRIFHGPHQEWTHDIRPISLARVNLPFHDLPQRRPRVPRATASPHDRSRTARRRGFRKRRRKRRAPPRRRRTRGRARA